MPNEANPNEKEESAFFLQSEILSGLSKEQQKVLMRAAKIVSLEKGEVVFNEGDKANSFFLIRKGSMRLVNYDKDGNERTIATFFAGEAVWESLFLGKEALYPYTGVAGDTLVCCAIEKKAFEDVASHSATSLHIISLLSKKLHDANERNRVLALNSPKAKVAGFLLYRAERQSSKILTLRLDDLASSLSLRPETASRKIQELIHEGYIKKTGQSAFIILDYKSLEEIAKN